MSEETPLNQVSGWSNQHVEKMRQKWITSAEQVVSLGSLPDGTTALANQLGVSPDEATTLIQAARSSLSPSLAARMEAKVDTSSLGLGALPPPSGWTNREER